jgi:hypothetical protein
MASIEHACSATSWFANLKISESQPKSLKALYCGLQNGIESLPTFNVAKS